MDSKISDFPSTQTVSVADVIPIVSGGTNKTLSIGMLVMNLPNLGNKGITKNVVYPAVVAQISITGTVVTLPQIGTPYSLPDGSDGQEITLVSVGANNVVIPVSSQVTSISMGIGSLITLIYIASISKWVPKSYHNCTLE